MQIPPFGKGALYIRPLLIGSGPIFGLAPAPEYTFLVYACPVGNYFKVSFLFKSLKKISIHNSRIDRILINVSQLQQGTAPLNLYVEEDVHRASRGGAGGVKSITNYAPVIK